MVAQRSRFEGNELSQYQKHWQLSYSRNGVAVRNVFDSFRWFCMTNRENWTGEVFALTSMP